MFPGRCFTASYRDNDVFPPAGKTTEVDLKTPKMSLFLPKLTCKKDIDEVIKGVAEKVVVLRFGRDEDSVCLQLDEIVRSL